MIIFLAFLVLLKPASAGFFSRVCSKLIIDSGLDYEAVPTEFLTKRLARLDQKIVWKAITPDERKEYALIESVLKLRGK